MLFVFFRDVHGFPTHCDVPVYLHAQLCLLEVTWEEEQVQVHRCCHRITPTYTFRASAGEWLYFNLTHEEVVKCSAARAKPIAV